jgi:hypothetical protein
VAGALGGAGLALALAAGAFLGAGF